jgi:hypothetical protein
MSNLADQTSFDALDIETPGSTISEIYSVDNANVYGETTIENNVHIYTSHSYQGGYTRVQRYKYRVMADVKYNEIGIYTINLTNTKPTRPGTDRIKVMPIEESKLYDGSDNTSQFIDHYVQLVGPELYNLVTE